MSPRNKLTSNSRSEPDLFEPKSPGPLLSECLVSDRVSWETNSWEPNSSESNSLENKSYQNGTFRSETCGLYLVQRFYGFTSVCFFITGLVVIYLDFPTLLHERCLVNFQIWSILLTIWYGLLTIFLIQMKTLGKIPCRLVERGNQLLADLNFRGLLSLFLISIIPFLISVLGFLYILNQPDGCQPPHPITSIDFWSNLIVIANGLSFLYLWLYILSKLLIPDIPNPLLDLEAG